MYQRLLLLVLGSLAVAGTRASVAFQTVVEASGANLPLLGDDKKNETKYHDTRMVIHIPFKHHKAKGEPHEVARWGGANVPWSGTLAEFVYYYDHHLCHHVEWNETTFPFWPKVSDGSTHQFIRPFILMAPPGPCSSVIWARRAQLVGAAALMIADDVCRCDDQTCINNFTAFDCRPAGQPVLINDGTAGDVSIPVWMVPKMVGQVLIDSVQKENQPALVEYAWGLPHDNTTDGDAAQAQANNTVVYHLWTAAAHDPQLTSVNVQELQQVVKAFHGNLVLAPKFRLLDGTQFNCPQFTDESTSPCDHLCTNAGRYCAVHQPNLSGHAVVREALRRLCIWKHYDQTAYWDYWSHHASVCSTPHLYADEDCVNQGLHQANIEPNTINDCMKESGDVDSDVSNALLQGMVEEQHFSGVVKLPAITHANSLKELDHGASAHSLFESVCMHYYWRSKDTNLHWEEIPTVCETCFDCPNLIGCLDQGKCVAFDHHSANHNGDNSPPKGGGNSSHHRVQRRRRRRWHFLLFLLVVALAAYGYKYYQQQQSNMYRGGGVGGGLLGSYLQLSGGDD